MKIYLLAFTILFNLRVFATNDMFASNFIFQPEYMDIEDGSPAYLGDIVFEARFIPANGFCGIYYKNKKNDCAVETKNWGSALVFYMKTSIIIELIKTEVPDSAQKTRSLEILSLVSPDQLLWLGHYERPVGAQGFVWKFNENAHQFTDPNSKTETFKINARAENLRRL